MQLKRIVTRQVAYGELLPLADEWRSIGILLEVPLKVIKNIAVEQTDSSVCLAEVLEWLENNSLQPRRKKFNDVMEKIKAAKPEKRR